MHNWYVNDHAQTSGDHEVHRDDCNYLPMIRSKTYLGMYSNCRDAVAKAKQYYPQSDGCAFCAPACNHG